MEIALAVGVAVFWLGIVTAALWADGIWPFRVKPEEIPERWVYQKKDRTLQIQQHEEWDRESGLYDRAIDRAYKASEAYRLEQELDQKMFLTNPQLWAQMKTFEREMLIRRKLNER